MIEVFFTEEQRERELWGEGDRSSKIARK